MSPKAPGSSTASIFDLDYDDNPQLKKEPELHPETPLTGTKKRGRKRKLETPTLKIKLKTPKPCDHSATDREEDDETKNLSRSFSSIKQRLKMLAKDMSTPPRRPTSQEPPATPLTLKIKRSTDGHWSSNSTPPSTGKLILKISNGRSSVTTTPRIKVKPVVQQKAKTEALPRLKISLGGKRPRGRRSATPSRSDAQTPSRLGSTPKSSFYPEGWVSFDQVKPDLGKNKSSDQSEGRISKIVNTLEHNKTISEELITANVDASNNSKKSTPVPEQKSVETKQDITMKRNLEQNPSTVAGSLNQNIGPVLKPDPEKSPLVEGSENRISFAVDRKPEISERLLPTAAVENRTKAAIFKPKISLRTDLFEIKSESPSPSPKVILLGVYIFP